MRSKTRGLWLISLVVLSPWLGGFELSRHSIDVDHIVDTGLDKDDIPALLAPRFVPAAEASWLRAGDELIGVVEGGVAKAYPVRILSWHEVVNDTLGDRPIAVTY